MRMMNENNYVNELLINEFPINIYIISIISKSIHHSLSLIYEGNNYRKRLNLEEKEKFVMKKVWLK